MGSCVWRIEMGPSIAQVSMHVLTSDRCVYCLVWLIVLMCCNNGMADSRKHWKPWRKRKPYRNSSSTSLKESSSKNLPVIFKNNSSSRYVFSIAMAMRYLFVVFFTKAVWDWVVMDIIRYKNWWGKQRQIQQFISNCLMYSPPKLSTN